MAGTAPVEERLLSGAEITLNAFILAIRVTACAAIFGNNSLLPGEQLLHIS